MTRTAQFLFICIYFCVVFIIFYYTVEGKNALGHSGNQTSYTVRNRMINDTHINYTMKTASESVTTENVVKFSTAAVMRNSSQVIQASIQSATQALVQNVTEASTNIVAKYSNENGSLTSQNVTKNPSVHEPEVTVECETPNQDIGYCIDIKSCPILLNQMENKELWGFLRASTCGLNKYNENSTKVCCGKYNNFRNASNNTVRDEVDILPTFCGYQKLFTKGRIIGGKEASLGEYPWMAILLHKNERGENILGCAGFLIHINYVLTAAHCTHPNLIKRRGPIESILLGKHDTQTAIDCSEATCVQSIQYEIDKVIQHTGFDPINRGQWNDIAIIKLKQNVRLTDHIQPICLISNHTKIPSKYYLSGWGTTEKGIRSNVKMKVNVPPFDKVRCAKKYSMFNITLTDTQFCVGGEYQKDSCKGDSGGPLMMVDKDEIWYAAGIVSFGVGCGEMGWPGVYTDIAKFLPWIKSQMTETN